MSSEITVPPVSLDQQQGLRFDSINEISRPQHMSSGGGIVTPTQVSGRGWSHGRYVGRDEEGRTNIASTKNEMQIGRDKLWDVNKVDSSGSATTFVISSNGTITTISTDEVITTTDYPIALHVLDDGVGVDITKNGVAVGDGVTSSSMDETGFGFNGASVDATLSSAGCIVTDATTTSTMDKDGYTYTGTTVTVAATANGVTVGDGTTSSKMDEDGLSYNGTSVDVSINAAGVKVDDSNTNTVIDESGWTYTGSTVVASLDETSFYMSNGTKNLSIAFADIDANMSIREIDVCDNGTPAKMLVIASAPY